LNKVEFKKNFNIGYEEIAFSANNGETMILIKNNYSVPSSTVSSSIINIEGSLFEEKRWGIIFSDLIETESDINATVNIELGRIEIDNEDFDEEEFLNHLMVRASNEIINSEYETVLKNMTVI
jgi:hypothetical protein